VEQHWIILSRTDETLIIQLVINLIEIKLSLLIKLSGSATPLLLFVNWNMSSTI